MLSACIVRYIFAVENHKKVRISINEQLVNEDSCSNSILMVFGFVVQQSEATISIIMINKKLTFFAGYFGKLFLTSSRILTIAVLTFSILIYQYYSSFIVGSILTETPKNIKTIKQLMNSHLAFGQDEVPYVIDNFYYAKEESTKELYTRMMKNPEKTLMSAQTGLSLVKKGKAFSFDAFVSQLQRLIA